jgi:hypothetical protein
LSDWLFVAVAKYWTFLALITVSLQFPSSTAASWQRQLERNRLPLLGVVRVCACTGVAETAFRWWRMWDVANHGRDFSCTFGAPD